LLPQFALSLRFPETVGRFIQYDAGFHFPVSGQFSATHPRTLRVNHAEESIPEDSDAVGDSMSAYSELDLHRGLSRDLAVMCSRNCICDVICTRIFFGTKLLELLTEKLMLIYNI